jgi:hypothetical protein
MACYMLCFEPRYQHAKHYIGWTSDPTPARRINVHLTKGAKSSPLVRAALDAGCEVRIAKTWDGNAAGRDFEAALKRRRDYARWCPACSSKGRKVPEPRDMTAGFKAAKPVYQCDPADNEVAF